MENTEENPIPQESTTMPGDCRGESGGIPRLQDKTGQDPTQPNPTRQDGGCGGSGQSSVVVFSFDRKKIHETMNRLLKVHKLSSLPTIQLWRVACLDSITHNGFAASLKVEFECGRVQKPLKYVNAAINNCCGEHLIDPIKFELERPKLSSELPEKASIEQ
jgi:hypothetical protein